GRDAGLGIGTERAVLAVVDAGQLGAAVGEAIAVVFIDRRGTAAGVAPDQFITIVEIHIWIALGHRLSGRRAAGGRHRDEPGEREGDARSIQRLHGGVMLHRGPTEAEQFREWGYGWNAPSERWSSSWARQAPSPSAQTMMWRIVWQPRTRPNCRPRPSAAAKRASGTTMSPPRFAQMPRLTPSLRATR